MSQFLCITEQSPSSSGLTDGKFVLREPHANMPRPECDQSMIGGGRKESQQR